MESVKATWIALFATSFATVRSSYNTVLQQFQHAFNGLMCSKSA